MARHPVRGGHLDDPGAAAGVRTLFTRSEYHPYAPAPVPRRNTSCARAPILLTPGSTRTPKGVVSTDAMVGACGRWATGYFRRDSWDGVSGNSPLLFALSTFDIYGTLSVGGQLHMVPPARNLLPQQLAEFIRVS